MKIITATMLMILLNNAAYAQMKLGIKIAPSVMNQRINNTTDSTGLSQEQITFAFPMIAIADITIGKNYFLSSGVGYISRRMMFRETASSSENVIDLRVQYLQIPVTLKLYTDEIAIDKRLYFQFGPVAEFKLYDKTVKGDMPEDVRPSGGNLTLLLAAGINIFISPNTALELGINYNRGLNNIFNYTGSKKEILDVRSDLFGIDVALKF